MKKTITLCMLAAVLLMPVDLFAVVKYDEGRMMIDGIQLLQDNTNPLEYYYLPQYPKLAKNEDGSFEFLCIKYVGENKESSGGLFHALIEYTLPDSLVKTIGNKLAQEKPGAIIVGPVPLMQAFNDGQEGVGSFQVVSAILSKEGGEDKFTRTVITSGHAPLTPGSKAVVASLLTPEGATLLWNSMQGATSDVSVSIHAYYEAAVKSYNAVVQAEMSTIYEHFSRVYGVQQDYTKRQLRRIVDDLKQDGTLTIDVFDRTSALGIKDNELDAVLSLVTDKLVELMFNAESGWSQEPEREVAVEPGQFKGRQNESWFSRTFLGSKDTKYYTDNQYVMKKREDIRTKTFYMNLSQSTTVKVPVYSSGNLGGLFSTLDSRYFRIVDMNDPAFQIRDLHFQIDGDYVDSFQDIINFVSVNFRKKYGANHDDQTKQIIINYQDVKSGNTIRSINYPRLGFTSSNWLDYEYQIGWSIKGENKTLKIPEGQDKWVRSNEPAISLRPPFDKRVLELDADRELFRDAGVVTAVIDFAAVLAGNARKYRSITLKSGDVENSVSTAIYHDGGEEIVYRVTWYNKNGRQYRTELQVLDSDYLYLVPPSEDKFAVL
ncbi:MAG: hypothetical protein IH592_01755 [Bacteroidales bacterium]|nr:hypothetical protein [Bacteroidales bacterium]